MTTIKTRRGLSTDWVAMNPILDAGEAGLETDTGQVKYGNGLTPWISLPYSGSGGVALASHVNSELPHPIYDDGSSFTLLYENVKV